MITRKALIPLTCIIAFACTSSFLVGCGPKDYQSEKEFLQSVHESGAIGADGDGTMPPEGESFDNVAQIRLETTDLDVGLIKNNELHHHKLKVYNDGKMPLKITKIDTTCMCTTGNVTPERAVVPGGGESWIDVVIDPNRIPGFVSHKILTITSTDPMRAQVSVDVRATVDPEYFLDTDTVDFGNVAKGEVLERRIRFRQVQDSPITVEGIEVLTMGITAAKVPGISAKLEEIPEDQWQSPGKREYDIVVATTPELSAGEFARSMALVTDLKRFGGKQRIVAEGTVLAPYSVAPTYPTRIFLSEAQPGGAFSAQAVFTATAPISVTAAESSDPIITAEGATGSSPNEAVLNVSVAAESMPRRLLDETVRVHVTVDGKTYTEIVGVRNGNPADADADEHAH